MTLPDHCDADAADPGSEPALLAPVADSVRDDSDDWLGCESLHPLTWLPPPGRSTQGKPR